MHNWWLLFGGIFNTMRADQLKKNVQGFLDLFLCLNSSELNADVFQKHYKMFCYRAVLSFLCQLCGVY